MRNRKVVLGVTGSIAAYKAISLLRRLTSQMAQVTVVMTRSAEKFISPLTFEVLSNRKVLSDLFAPSHEMAHISLAESADLIVIAPATANFIAKVSAGMADDLLSAMILATRAPIIMAPAMDGEMWYKTATQRNVEILKKEGVRFVSPEKGLLASGKTGVGRLADEESILGEISRCFNEKQDFHRKKITISAGPTLEPIDPVRFISNRSSGKMGYALAEEAVTRGADVTLISGPTKLKPPDGVKVISVQTGEEMAREAFNAFPGSDIFIMSAAVSDYRVSQPSQEKIKKKGRGLQLDLTPVKDILAELGKMKVNQILVGFAAETESADRYPVQKLKEKKLDLIVANNITLKGAEFGSDSNIVTFYDKAGRKEAFPLLSKRKVAENIFNKILTFMSHS